VKYWILYLIFKCSYETNNLYDHFLILVKYSNSLFNIEFFIFYEKKLFNVGTGMRQDTRTRRGRGWSWISHPHWVWIGQQVSIWESGIVLKLGSVIDSAGVLGHWVNGQTTESLVEPHDWTGTTRMTRLDDLVLD